MPAAAVAATWLAPAALRWRWRCDAAAAAAPNVVECLESLFEPPPGAGADGDAALHWVRPCALVLAAVTTAGDITVGFRCSIKLTPPPPTPSFPRP